jgi:hypothetical protein
MMGSDEHSKSILRVTDELANIKSSLKAQIDMLAVKVHDIRVKDIHNKLEEEVSDSNHCGQLT